MGNITSEGENKLLPQLRVEFYLWDQIQSIKFIRKGHKGVWGGIIRDYVYLKSKKDKVHECIVYNKEGFIQALRKMDKSYLLKINSEHNKRGFK